MTRQLSSSSTSGASDPDALEVVAEKAVRSLEDGQRRVEEGQRRLETVLASIQRDISRLTGFVSGSRAAAAPAPEPRPRAAASCSPDGIAPAEEPCGAAEGVATPQGFRLQDLGRFINRGCVCEEKARTEFDFVEGIQVGKPSQRMIHYGELEDVEGETEAEQTNPKPSQASMEAVVMPSDRCPNPSVSFQNSVRARGSVAPRSSSASLKTTRSAAPGAAILPQFSLLSNEGFRDRTSQEGFEIRTSQESARWPRNIGIRSTGEGDEDAEMATLKRAGRHLLTGRSKRQLPDKQTVSETDVGSPIPWFVVHPSSNVYALWSTLGAIFLLNDLTMTPFVLAWDVSIQSGWLWVVAWVTPAFWTVDIAFCFITGFYAGGRLETRLPELAKHYLRTWCAPDCLIVLCDWAGVALQAVSKDDGLEGTDAIRVLRIGKTVKMLRIAGLMRLTRLLRLANSFKALKEFVEEKTAGFPVSSQCAILSVCAVWLNHVIGCLWFAVGRLADSDTGKRWIDFSIESGGVYMPFLEEGMWYQYTTSFHWSLAQFTLGSIEIYCTNTTERLFNITCLMIGMIFGSTLVSSLSAGMVDFQMRMMERKNKIRRFQRYLRENKVGPPTSIMVQEQVEARLKIQERLKERDVPAIELLSNVLRIELRHEIVKPHLVTLPVYALLFHMDLATFQAIVMEAVGFAYPHQQDDLFVAGTKTDKAYQLMAGTMVYTRNPDESLACRDVYTAIEVDTWLSEAALWCQWTHVGTCKATSVSHVLTLSAEECLRITYRAPSVRRVFQEYCQAYHAKVIVACPPEEDFCDDLQVPNTGWDILVPIMDEDVQEEASLCVVDQLEASFMWIGKNSNLEALRKDIMNGESALIIDSHGQPERLVSAVTARIVNSEHFYLMKIAKADEERPMARPCFKFPKLKLHARESGREGLRRLLEKLGLQEEDVRESEQEVQVEHKQSSKFGIRSRCTSTVIHLEAEQNTSLPMVGTVAASELSRRESLTASLRLHRLTRQGTARSNARWSGVNSFNVAAYHPRGHVDLDLLSIMIYKYSAGGTHEFYAWLPTSRIEHFSSAAGKKDLAAWVSNLRRPRRGDTRSTIASQNGFHRHHSRDAVDDAVGGDPVDGHGASTLQRSSTEASFVLDHAPTS